MDPILFQSGLNLNALYVLPEMSTLTPARTYSIRGLKSWVMKLTFLALKNDKKWSRTIYFEIHRACSEMPANLPGQFSLTRQIFLHWAWAGARDFSPLIKWDLAVVHCVSVLLVNQAMPLSIIKSSQKAFTKSKNFQQKPLYTSRAVS